MKGAYAERLVRARMIWCAFMGFIWVAYMLAAGWDTDVTGFLAIIWGIGYPRNWAKWKAKQRQRLQEFEEAVEEESRK
jgi:hypothetical protein